MIGEFLLAPGARLLPTRDSKAITRRQVEKKGFKYLSASPPFLISLNQLFLLLAYNVFFP
jgi:hypothetical protein